MDSDGPDESFPAWGIRWFCGSYFAVIGVMRTFLSGKYTTIGVRCIADVLCCNSSCLPATYLYKIYHYMYLMCFSCIYVIYLHIYKKKILKSKIKKKTQKKNPTATSCNVFVHIF